MDPKRLENQASKIRLKPRKRPRQQRAQATAESIRQATLELIGREGFAGLSAIKIARRAGASVGSFYDYYPSKEAVLLDLYERTSSLLVRHMRERLAEILDLPVIEAVERSIRTLLELHERHRVILIDLLQQMPELRLANHPVSFENLGHGSILIYLEHRGRALATEELETKAYFLEQIIIGCIRQFISHPPRHVSRGSFIANLTQIITPYMKELTGEGRLELARPRS